ncbi:exonuclease SbcCD subunit D C-terminal domain-containing protein [Microvirga sp. STS02]|uniref:exonuclease subunit SbcD n=1 Tax=Hymenobacter negativus TaxID=2795026 RepID=UPI0018DC8D83|nr:MULTISPECIES: exonuclease subunit SbcD [Bacteria]MBH8569777.1 exonuclease SbcCD subunit D C-terminal domain-containing protein [Hymenobacter negativus]MBR7209515.1 exonuclease SbcCD subunit D C-terminal domain-containing protein [Microvirga sp. STS02]
MRVLHTADWHLGQHFLTGQERTTEQQAFLDWLLLTVQAQAIEVLVIAGDIFDTQTPSYTAQELYYTFLVKMQATGCRDIVVVGGNHDSPTMLNASRRLLRQLRIHVVGGVPTDATEQILHLSAANGRPGLVVCAVPFLRDRDIRLAVAGETPDDRQLRIRQSIAGHYAALADHESVVRQREHDVPVLATGHLYAAGGEAREGAERDVHIGGLGLIGAEHFPAAFDYVALGHLHRPQVVGGRAHIRYSGSPVPLSFTEADDKQQVLLLEFSGAGAPAITSLPVPVTRRLQRFHGTLEEVEADILAFDNSAFPLVAWADVLVRSDETPAEVQRRVQAVLQLQKAQVLAPRGVRHQRATEAADLAESTIPLALLHELTVDEVFSRRVASLPPERAAALAATFGELRQLLAEADPLAWGGTDA